MSSRTSERLFSLQEAFDERNGEDRKERDQDLKLRSKRFRSELVARYGYGDDAQYRLRVYDKMQAIVDEYGHPALELARVLMASASKMNYPDRWFIKAWMSEVNKRGWGAPSVFLEGE